MLGTGNHENPPIHNPNNAARPLLLSSGVRDSSREDLDCDGSFYWLGHFKSFLSRDFHLMDVPSMELDVPD